IRDKLVTGVQTCALPIFDIKYKGSDDNNDTSLKDNAKALREIQAEPWQNYNWIDQSDHRSRELFSSQMHLRISTHAGHHCEPARSEERRVGKAWRSGRCT